MNTMVYFPYGKVFFFFCFVCKYLLFTFLEALGEGVIFFELDILLIFKTVREYGKTFFG